MDEEPTVAERSVARGAAAPTTAGDAPTSALPGDAAPRRTGHVRAATSRDAATSGDAAAGVAAAAWVRQLFELSPAEVEQRPRVCAHRPCLVVLIGAGVSVFLVASGDDDDSSPTTQATDRTVTETKQGTTDSTEPTTDSTEPTLPSGSDFAAFTADTGGYSADLPTGGGWSEPRERQVNPGLWEVTSAGPGGMELLINYTPDEPASVTPDDSCVPVDHPAFSDARKCVFRGGAFEVCQRSRCIDYLLNDGSSGPGYAVLVGGGDPDEAEQIADRVASSFSP